MATELSEGSPARSVEEQDLLVRRVSVERFESMVGSGEIKDAPSIAAYGLLGLKRPGAQPPGAGRR